MLTFVLRRLAIACVVLLGVTVLTYGLLNAVPGDPVSMMIPPELGEESREALERALGLDQPFLVRYWRWLGQIVQGNFGYSHISGAAVSDLISARLPATLLLMATAITISYVIAIPTGVFVANRRYSKLDYTVTFASFSGLSVPNFFVGLILIYIFSLRLNVLPSQVFGWPGMGHLFIRSTMTRDYPIIMALTLISAVLVIVGNLVADVAYGAADPRIRESGR